MKKILLVFIFTITAFHCKAQISQSQLSLGFYTNGLQTIIATSNHRGGVYDTMLINAGVNGSFAIYPGNPTDAQILIWNATDTQWTCVNLSGDINFETNLGEVTVVGWDEAPLNITAPHSFDYTDLLGSGDGRLPFFNGGSANWKTYNFSGGLSVNDTGLATLNLTTYVSGVLQVTNGGTGSTSNTAHGVLIGEGTGSINTTGTGTTGYVLTGQGSSADPIWAPASTGVTSITGTANEVLANGTSGSAQTGAVTLTTPQAIGTASAVQFGSLNLGTGALNTVGNITFDGTTARTIAVKMPALGPGNSLTIIGAAGFAAAGNAGGKIIITAGAGSATSTGGSGADLNLNGGNAGGTGTNSGGNVNITGGNSTGTGGAGNGGYITIQGGASAGGSRFPGYVWIKGGTPGSAPVSNGGGVSLYGGDGYITGVGSAGQTASVIGGLAKGTADNNGGAVYIDGGKPSHAGIGGILYLGTNGSGYSGMQPGVTSTIQIGSNNAVVFDGGVSMTFSNTITTAANYTFDNTQNDFIVIESGDTTTVTLPPTASFGRICIVKFANSTALNSMTVSGNGSNIDGNANYTLSSINTVGGTSGIIVVGDGANWNIVSQTK